MPDDPTMAGVLEDVLAARLAEVNTMMPGQVQSWDRTLETADVVPLVQRPEGRAYSVVRGAKVVFPVAYYDLQAGDTGLLIYGQWDFSRWWRTGTVGTPEQLGQHSAAVACFLPGLRSKAASRSVPSGATVLEGSDVRLGDDGASEAVIRGDAYTGHEDTFLIALGVAVAACMTALQTTPANGVVSPAQLVTFNNALSAFRGQLPGDLSTKVSVD